MKIPKEINRVFVTRYLNTKGLIILVAVCLTVYAIGSIFREDAAHPLWMIWWGLAGAYGAATGSVVVDAFERKKKTELDTALANPSGMRWTVYTVDGAQIGEIGEANYLKAKHEADMCYRTMVFQVLNYVWVTWAVFVRTLTAIPAIFVLAVFAYQISGADGSLAEITIGQIFESGLVGNSVLILFILMLAVFLMRGATGVPGYKNYYKLRLRKLLAKHIPNIANANGFYITGYKIDLDSGKAEIRLS